MASNINALIEQGKRSLNNGNKEEAQGFLIRATELDENNEDAWLWLASAVETEEEQRICLENVLVLNPANADAQRMLAELDRDGTGGEAIAFEGFDTTADSSPTDAPTADPFGDVFDSGFDTGGDDSSFGEDDGPFSAEGDFGFSTPAPPTLDEEPADSADETMLSPAYEAPPDEDSTDDDMSLSDLYEDDTAAADDPFDMPPRYDESILEDVFEEEEEEEIDYLEFLPEDIKPTRLPGTDEGISAGYRVGLGLLAVLNVLAVVALVAQVVL